MAFAYTVRVVIEDARAFEGFVAWLRDTHVADVCAAGGCTGEVLVLDVAEGEPRAVEARYRFASREAFRAYERDHAPRMRADGLAALERLGVEPGRGVTFHRSTGDLFP